MSLRDRATTVAHGAGLIEGLRRARPWLPLRWLTILTYHRVVDLPEDYCFDGGVADATPDTFAAQMEVLSRECDPIDLAQLRRVFDGEPLPPRPVLVTFDDGYRDNHDVALPILQRFGVPAVFFVATQPVSERRLFWWDRIAYLLATTDRERIAIDYPVPLTFSLPEQRDEAARILLRIIKSHYALDLPRMLDALEAACGVTWNDEIERELADGLLMSWDHVRELRAHGMEVQSHTVRHRPLHTITLDLLSDELRISRQVLERELDHPVDTLALPVGRPIEVLPPLERAVADAGYRFAFSNNTGVVSLRPLPDPLRMKRVATEAEWSLATFRAAVHFPAL